MSSAQAPGAARDYGREVRGHVVTTLLAGSCPDVRLAAGALRVSARTLQRRLGDQGLTYAAVLAQVRCDLARQMLEDPARRIGDVARTLGYSDGAHFTRAFLRWTGVTPRAFRRQEGRAPSAARYRRRMAGGLAPRQNGR